MLKRLSKSKALVACHDAGAANQILYLTHALDNVEYLLEGPAKSIAVQLGIVFREDINAINIEEYGVILCGSNTKLRVSDQVLLLARQKGIQTIGFLDNWSGYRDRWKVHPDMIIAGDLYALFQGFFIFGFKIRFLKSRYLGWLKDERDQMHLEQNSDETILIVLQPIGMNYSHSENLNTCICGYFLKSARVQSYPYVLLRQHFSTPALNCLKYLTKEFPQISFSLTGPNSSLIEDLIRVSLVIGIDSYALYVAKRLGYSVKTISASKWSARHPNYRKFM